MTQRDIRYQAAVVAGAQLLLLRCRTRDGAEFWLLPGGGREEGEAETECVVREVREETGVEVAVGAILYELPADPPDGTYRLWRTYLCRIIKGAPAPGSGEQSAQITAVRWLALDDSESWEREVLEDAFLYPQLRLIQSALGLLSPHA